MNIFSVVFQDFQLLSLPLGQNVAGVGANTTARGRTKCLTDAGFGERSGAAAQGAGHLSSTRTWPTTGVEVSGGEAQKIAIARALYKDAPFIILDEPTAALDPIAEAEIYAQFNEIAGRQDRRLHQPPALLLPFLRRDRGLRPTARLSRRAATTP